MGVLGLTEYACASSIEEESGVIVVWNNLALFVSSNISTAWPLEISSLNMDLHPRLLIGVLTPSWLELLECGCMGTCLEQC